MGKKRSSSTRRQRRRKKRRNSNTYLKNILVLLLIIVLILLFAVFFKNFSFKNPITMIKNEFQEKYPKNIYYEDMKKLMEELDQYYTNKIITEKYSDPFEDLKEYYLAKSENIDSNDEFGELLFSFLRSLKDNNSFLLSEGFLNQFEILTKDAKVLNDLLKQSNYLKDEDHLLNDGLELSNPLKNIAYIKIPSFDEELRIQDGEKIRSFLENQWDIPYIIIDIRGNQGYSVDYFIENLVFPLSSEVHYMDGEYLVRDENSEKYYSAFSNYLNIDPIHYDTKEIVKKYHLNKSRVKDYSYYRKFSLRSEPAKNLRFHGKIYLLQDEETSFAGDLFSQFCNRTGFATTCGSYTQGYGMDLLPGFYQLPHTKYTIAYSIRSGLNEDGSFNAEKGTFPEIQLNEQDSLLQLIDMLR
ncbi:MAG: S41 family peptidase [Tissierellia bacterium]|nr:S41 family peptidase [Tissierellia bacterium]